MANTYFQIENHTTEFINFNGIIIPGSFTPGFFEVFKSFGMDNEDFVKKANGLFYEYSINIPDKYNENLPPDEFAICICCCINIKEKYPEVDISRILKRELIKKNIKKHDFSHATTLASIALYYLVKGFSVEILSEEKGKKILI